MRGVPWSGHEHAILGLAVAGAHPAGPAGAASATSFSRRIGTEARSSRLKPLLQGHVLRFRRDSGRLHLPPARPPPPKDPHAPPLRSEEHTSELPTLMRNSYAVFCLKKKNTTS